ncbi:MAG: ribosomal RNA small subunit methyltransferase A [Oligoflexia bacterium]|nr:MAG: ribosomal RNA small subunit methyltransferase A [Oligoflexia bacterium]
MTARQRITQLMTELNIEPKRALGQNFLISDHVIKKIVHAVSLFHPKGMIEVGPGLGALTVELRQLNCPLHLIELDSVFANYWKAQGLSVSEVDALQWDWRSHNLNRPEVLVSNLPYQISSSLVIDRSMDENQFDGMVLMFQKEVAQRLRAKPKTSEYGMLSVVAQTFWNTEMLLEAGPGDFMPSPKVASRVLVFAKKDVSIDDRKKYLKFLKAAFLHPRKLMSSNLEQGLGIAREIILEKLAAQGFDPKIRAQEMSVKMFQDLYLRFQESGK